MSLNVKVLGRSRLQGPGYETTGVTSTSKEFVWGELTGTYVTTGVPFTPGNIGLQDIDFINLQPVSVNAGTDYTATTQINANFDESTGVIFMQTEVAAGDKTEATQTAYVVNFVAFGTSIRNPQLL